MVAALQEANARLRAENALVGGGDTLKSKALEVIMEATVGAPMQQRIYSKPATVAAPAVHAPEIGGILGDVIGATDFSLA